MLESKFQSDLVKEIRTSLPGCVVHKTDPSQSQGFPDLLILYEGRWATLECKQHQNSPHRPNQDYWVDKLNEMSFSAFIYPENKQEVIDEMVGFFKGISTRKSHTV